MTLVFAQGCQMPLAKKNMFLTKSDSYIGLVVHPELSIRPIGRSSLELLAIQLEDEWLFRNVSLWVRKGQLEAEDCVLLGNCYSC